MGMEIIQNKSIIRQSRIIKQITKLIIFINRFIHIDIYIIFNIFYKCNKELNQLSLLWQYLQERYKVLHHLSRGHHQAQGLEEYLVQSRV